MEVDPGALINYLGAGAGAGGAIAIIFKLLEWLGARYDAREDRLIAAQVRVDAATMDLIAQLQLQVDDLRGKYGAVLEELEECRDRHAHSQEELARLRGVVSGLGDSRQHAQLIVSNEAVKKKVSDGPA